MKKTDRSRTSRWVPVALLMFGCLAPQVPVSGSSAWRHSAVWDDGNAEFCAYDIGWARYGRVYEGQAFLIAVKEPWAPDLEVKADAARTGGFDVIKLNHIRDVPTGIYTYHQMASLFVRRGDGGLQKLSVTSSEGCGVSTAHLVDGRLQTRSYFDGQGEREQRYPSGVLPEDGLPLALRDYLEGPLDQASIEVFPSLMTGKFPELASRRMKLARRSGSRTVPAGTFDTIELELVDESRRFSFSFAVESPHPLIRFASQDGTTYSLAKCERIPYWQMTNPDGRTWLPK